MSRNLPGGTDAVAADLAEVIAARRLAIFVPPDTGQVGAVVAPGSAIVGSSGHSAWPAPSGMVMVDYGAQ
jgi:hypothetical protein